MASTFFTKVNIKPQLATIIPMKMLLLLPLLLLLNGCLYFNKQGVSTTLYDGCQEYYDDEGKYVKECPNNLMDYEELGK